MILSPTSHIKRLIDQLKSFCLSTFLFSFSGYGRNDSPGHCAKFCTYCNSVMNHDTHDLLAVTTIDKREVALKSPNMEKMGWERSLELLLKNKICISEMVTDAHVQITAEMSKLIYFGYNIILKANTPFK